MMVDAWVAAGRSAVGGVVTCVAGWLLGRIADLAGAAVRPRAAAAPVRRDPPRAAPRTVPPPSVQPAPTVQPAPPAPALPAAYGDDRVVLLPRDPWWLFAYWEVTPRTRIEALRTLGPDAEGALAILRVSDVAGTEAPLEVELPPGADRWYVEVPRAGTAWIAEVGLRTRAGRFVPLVTSEAAATPPAAPSAETTSAWARPPAEPATPPEPVAPPVDAVPPASALPPPASAVADAAGAHGDPSPAAPATAAVPHRGPAPDVLPEPPGSSDLLGRAH